MRFAVGPYFYVARLVEGYLEHEGERCLGLCDNGRMEVLVSDRVPASQRMAVLGHELMHAWIYHHGRPADDEGLCNLYGTALAAFAGDLMRAVGASVALDEPAAGCG